MTQPPERIQIAPSKRAPAPVSAAPYYLDESGDPLPTGIKLPDGSRVPYLRTAPPGWIEQREAARQRREPQARGWARFRR